MRFLLDLAVVVCIILAASCLTLAVLNANDIHLKNEISTIESLLQAGVGAVMACIFLWMGRHKL